MRYFVNFTKEVMAQILLNGFEAYVIQHKGKKRSGIEMFASLYGSLAKETASTKHYNVKFLSVDTSADMQSGGVNNKDETLQMKKKLAEGMDFIQLGTIHSHPYLPPEMKLAEVRKRGCNFSDDDLALFRDQLNKNSGHFLQVILTIRKQDRESYKRDGAISKNIFEFSVAGCKCFINAQCFTLNDQNQLISEQTILKCEHLQNFVYIAEHGKVETAKGKKRILIHK